MLVKAVERNVGEFTISDVAVAIAESRWQLWAAIESDAPVAAAVTELVRYPRKLVARVILLGGVDFDEWKHLISGIEDWALTQGCTALEAITRPGMAKRAVDVGFEEKYRVVVKDLRGRLQ